jgi:hypothetical protein
MRALLIALGVLLLGPVAAAQPRDEGGQTDALARLHGDLRLNPAQEAAWGEFAAAVGSLAEGEQRRRAAAQMMSSLPTPRRLALMQATLAADLADLKRTDAAVVRFYGQLTTGQQQTFDRETLPAPGFDRATR